MIVNELFEKYKKTGLWTFRVSNKEGYLIDWCNNSRSYEEISKAIGQLEVFCFDSGYESITAMVNIVPEATYQSEEKCKMDGYKKIFTDPQRGPIYAKETFAPNAYNGDADSIGFTFATIERYC